MLKAKAFAKINWSLHIVGRRADGYHLLDSIMQPIALHDDICAENAQELSLEVVGESPCHSEENLVLRAAKALNDHCGTTFGAKIKLHKRIPAQAGLGGGSSDCAAALRLLRALWKLEICDKELMQIGLGLGADVPFCLMSRLCRVQGIGEELAPMEGAKRVPLVLMQPTMGAPTAEVFSLLDRDFCAKVHLSIDNEQKALSNGNWEEFGRISGNDLLPPAVKLVPEIDRCIQALLALGSVFASMSGSGSCVFGVFADAVKARQAADALGSGAIVTETLA